MVKRNREDEPCTITQAKLCGNSTCLTCKSRSAESSEIINTLKWSDESVIECVVGVPTAPSDSMAAAVTPTP